MTQHRARPPHHVPPLRWLAARRIPRLVILAIATTACVLLGMSLDAVADAINLTGTWVANYHCTSGWCAGQDFPDSVHLTQAVGSSSVTGSNAGGGTFTGTLNGLSFSLISSVGSYVSTLDLTIAPDGESWSGTGHDTNGTNGIYTATRTLAPGESSTAVFCNVLRPDQPDEVFVCAAVVAGGIGTGPAHTPTGTVSFALDAGVGGSFAGPSCELAPSQTGGSTAFCTTEYTPPPGGIPIGSQPAFTATYGGDDTLSSSSGRPTSVVSSRTASRIGQIVQQNADQCLVDAIDAPKEEFLPRLTSPPSIQYQPTDTATARAAKTCAFPIRGIGYVAGGAAWVCGSICEIAGDERVAGATMMTGAGMFYYAAETGPAAPFTATTGAGVFVVGAVNAYVAKPVGSGLRRLGSYIVDDPPDPEYRTIPRPARVKRIATPPKSPRMLKKLVAFKLAADKCIAAMDAMSAAINRAGGARIDGEIKWQRRQIRASIKLAKATLKTLDKLSSTREAVDRELAGFMQTLPALSAEQIAQAKEASNGPLELPPAVVKLLDGFGIPLSALHDAVAQATPGVPVATTLQVSPVFDSEITFGKAMLVLYPKLADIQAQAAR